MNFNLKKWPHHYKCIVFSFALLYSGILNSQIVNLNRNPVYQRVFVDTDDFDTSYLSQLEMAIEHVSIDSVRYAMINDHAYYWHTRDIKKAKLLIDIAIKSLDKRSNLWLGRYQITQGAILLRSEKLDSAYLVLQEAKSRVLPEDMPFLYTQLTYVMERRGKLDEAADFAMEALRKGQELNDRKAIALAYSDLSYFFYKQGKFEKALEYASSSEQIFKERGLNDLDYSFTLYIIGVYHHALKDYEKAQKYLNESIKMSETYGFYNNLSDTYVDLTDLYIELKNYESALDASVKSIKYAKLIKNDFLLTRAWSSLGRLQNLTGNHNEAIKNLGIALNTATDEFGDEYWLQQIYGELADAYAKSHQYESAYHAFKVYDQLKDSIFTEEADRRVAQLQTEHEVAQKESTILQQQQELQQRKKVQLLTIGMVILLLLILFGLYRNYIYNKRTSEKLSRLNTNLEQKNKELDIKNQENVILLKEIHHRVKNNLQVLSSLLSLQSDYIADPAALDAVIEGRNRVQSMGLLHQKLYMGDHLSAVNVREYIQDLINHLGETFGVNRKINFELDIRVEQFDIDTAIPLGLIINELVTNSLKYAFPDQKNGKITIQLWLEKPTQLLVLKVADNGVGLQENHEHSNATNFGTDLIKVLSKKLKGSITHSNENGYSTIIQFKRFKLPIEQQHILPHSYSSN